MRVAPPQGRPTGRPRPGRLLDDGVRSAVAQPAATITAVLVVAVVCLVVLATAGRTAAAEHQVMSRIDGVGTRLVTAVDPGGDAGVRPASVGAIAGSDHVTWAVGLGSVTDVRNLAVADIGSAVPLRTLYGALPDAVPLVAGRAPGPGEAVVGHGAATALGLGGAAGTVTDGAGRTWPVVGIVQAGGPLASLDDGILVPADPGASQGEVRYLYVLADEVAAVDVVADTVPALAVAENAAALEIETPAGAIALREVVAGDLGAASRQLMAIVLGIGLVLVGITMFGAVAGRRRDFGRRRALGASRSAVVVLVLVQAVLAAAVGAVVGCTVGLVAVRLLAGALPDPAFVAGVGALAVLLAAVGSVPPAVAAARRDPVRILRVP